MNEYETEIQTEKTPKGDNHRNIQNDYGTRETHFIFIINMAGSDSKPNIYACTDK